MRGINHRGQRGRLNRGKKDFVRPLLLGVLCGRYSLVLFLAALMISSTAAQIQTRQPISTEKHSRYQIKLALDFANRTYVGTELSRSVNHRQPPTPPLYFHLYPNVRLPRP